MSARAATQVSGEKLRVRMYRVGFGDFFLLTLMTKEAPLHILIDCGVHAGDLGSIAEAVADMARETDRHLSLVVVTHRHADHISGFATRAKEFAGFTVDAIWMSWWDDPGEKAAVDAQNNLTLLATQVQVALAARDDEAGKQALRMAENITGPLGAVGGGNAAALELLRRPGFKHAPKPRYWKAGDAPELPPALVKAGLSAQILGPPISPELLKQMSRSSEEYLAVAGEGASAGKVRPFAEHWRTIALAHIVQFSDLGEQVNGKRRRRKR